MIASTSGKTAALIAICRAFSLDPALRRIQRSDFHVPVDEDEPPAERTLWIELDFSFPELKQRDANTTVAPHFGHMRLDEPAGIVNVEEPENSLSAHYLGRIVSALTNMASNSDAQALIATHAPSMLRRVEPGQIRYLRLSAARESKVTRILMPAKRLEAYKFVREAVQAFPEIYFSRLVVLGEGDSEEVVLPRILRAKGTPVDESAVTIAPLGGRHVNHFWRLLSVLQIPYQLIRQPGIPVDRTFSIEFLDSGATAYAFTFG